MAKLSSVNKNNRRIKLSDRFFKKRQRLKKLTKDQIFKNIDKLKKDLFNLRFQKINSQITNPAKIGETKKIIARLKTTLKRKTDA